MLVWIFLSMCLSFFHHIPLFYYLILSFSNMFLLALVSFNPHPHLLLSHSHQLINSHPHHLSLSPYFPVSHPLLHSHHHLQLYYCCSITSASLCNRLHPTPKHCIHFTVTSSLDFTNYSLFWRVCRLVTHSYIHTLIGSVS